MTVAAAWLTGFAHAELHTDLLEALKQRRHNPDAEPNPRMFGCVAARTKPALLPFVAQVLIANAQWHAMAAPWDDHWAALLSVRQQACSRSIFV